MKKKRYSLQRTMIVYFLLIAFASLLVGVEFAADMNNPILKEKLLSNYEAYSSGKMGYDQLFQPIVRLRDKAILMLAIILFVTIIVLTMFIKNITEPLQHMIQISRKIAKGDLSHTIHIRSDNELSELGNVINDMSSNLQEIILLSRSMSESGHQFVERISQIVDSEPENPEAPKHIREEISQLKNELDVLKEVIECFSFYSTENRGG